MTANNVLSEIEKPEIEQPFWSLVPTLGDYSQLLYDYDVAAVEEEAMQAELSYGW